MSGRSSGISSRTSQLPGMRAELACPLSPEWCLRRWYVCLVVPEPPALGAGCGTAALVLPYPFVLLSVTAVSAASSRTFTGCTPSSLFCRRRCSWGSTVYLFELVRDKDVQPCRLLRGRNSVRSHHKQFWQSLGTIKDAYAQVIHLARVCLYLFAS